jgi:hypothetical protein
MTETPVTARESEELPGQALGGRALGRRWAGRRWAGAGGRGAVPPSRSGYCRPDMPETETDACSGRWSELSPTLTV